MSTYNFTYNFNKCKFNIVKCWNYHLVFHSCIFWRWCFSHFLKCEFCISLYAMLNLFIIQNDDFRCKVFIHKTIKKTLKHFHFLFLHIWTFLIICGLPNAMLKCLKATRYYHNCSGHWEPVKNTHKRNEVFDWFPLTVAVNSCSLF